METWVSWLDNISKRVTAIPGVTADVRQPRGLSNRSPGLTIRWDPVKFGISGEEVAQHLYITEPRIALGGGGAAAGRGAQNGLTSIGISASMMAPGKRQSSCRSRLRDPLQAAPAQAPAPAQPPGDRPRRSMGRADRLHRRQRPSHALHQSGREPPRRSASGDFVGRDLSGTIDGDDVRICSNILENSSGDHLEFTFTGKVSGSAMSGDLDTAEYFNARWTAQNTLLARGSPSVSRPCHHRPI